eukprot:6177423-Pleurochrysis_carterae.AAC.2
MVETPTQREPLDNKMLSLVIPTDDPPLAILRMQMRRRIKHHIPPKGLAGVGGHRKQLYLLV